MVSGETKRVAAPLPDDVYQSLVRFQRHLESTTSLKVSLASAATIAVQAGLKFLNEATE